MPSSLPQQSVVPLNPSEPEPISNVTLDPDKTGPAPSTDEGNLLPTLLPPKHSKGLDFLAPPLERDEIGRLGDYRVLGVLGRGGMGLVLHAENTKLQRPVALKVMKPDMVADGENRERFLREARAAAAVKHDHVIDIYHVNEVNGVPFLEMPLLQGEPLDKRLQQRPGTPLPLVDVLRIGREVAEGLAAAHAMALIHRDIKPGNIWLESSAKPGALDRVKLLDFGLARFNRDEAPLTCPGAVMGTPAYMAPEQARGQEIDARADLFSLGCVLYEMATGRRPFNGVDTLAILMALANETPRPVRKFNEEVPEELASLIERLLSKDPDGRPASAQEVADELAAIDGQFAKQSTQKVVPRRLSGIGPKDLAADRKASARSGRKVRVVSISAAALAVALGLMGGLWHWFGTSGNPAPGTPAPVSSAGVHSPRPMGLAVRAWHSGRYVDLTDRVPLRTKAELEVRAEAPAGMHLSLFVVNGTGNLKLLATYAPRDTAGALRFPEAVGESAPLTGPGGTEMILVCGRRSGPVTEEELRSHWGAANPWPALPDESVLRLTPDRIVVEQRGRDLGDLKSRTNPEGEVQQRLEAFRLRLRERVDGFEALAFRHQE